MAKKRIRIDMEDADGAKYDFKLEGNVTRVERGGLNFGVNCVNNENSRLEWK